MLFEAGLARGEGGLSPAHADGHRRKGDYAFLSLKAPAFDLSDRGVGGRPVPAGSMPSSMPSAASIAPTRPSISPRCCATPGRRGAGVPLTLVVERPDGVEFRRASCCRPGRGRPQPGGGAAGFGADRHLAGARLHRSETAAGRRNHFHGRGLRPRPDRIRSDLARAGRISQKLRPNSRSTAISSMARRPPASSSKAT